MDKKRLAPLLLLPMVPLLFAGCYRACYNCDGSTACYYSTCLANNTCENNNCWGLTYQPVLYETVRYKELRALSTSDFEITNPEVTYSLENGESVIKASFDMKNKTDVTAIFNSINVSVFVNDKYYVTYDISSSIPGLDVLEAGQTHRYLGWISKYVNASAAYEELSIKVDVNAYAIIK